MTRPIFPAQPAPSRLSALLAAGAAMGLISLSACSKDKVGDEDAAPKAAPPAQISTSAPEPSPGGTPTTQGKPENGAATVNTQDVRH